MNLLPRSGAVDGSQPEGVVVVDKPAGWTSHDLVARVRRIADTKRVGHAGTLDPMATGVLVVGIGRATRLLGYLAGHDKDYLATIRLGMTTSTDDVEGEPLASYDAGGVAADAVREAMQGLTGDIEQVPPAVSAIKVRGQRAYRRARSGEEVVLAARPVTVARFELLTHHGTDLDVAVSCSSGTYIRALARDLGAALGVGAHLTALRRTRVGAFGVDQAASLDQLAQSWGPVPLAQVVATNFPRVDVSADDAIRIGHGQKLPLALPDVGPVGVFAPDDSVIALVANRDGVAKPLCVFV